MMKARQRTKTTGPRAISTVNAGAPVKRLARGNGILRNCATLPLLAITLVSAHEKLALAESPTSMPLGAHYKPLCLTPDGDGRRCFRQILVDANEQPISDPDSPPGGWTPTELRAAYGLP